MPVAFEREVLLVRDAGVAGVELSTWRTAHGLVAGITTRGPAGDFNLGLMTSDDSRSVTNRWRQVGEAFKHQFPSIAVSLQPHGAEVREHESEFDGWLVLSGYDGHVTRHAGILLTVTVADCVPVYLAHPPTGGVALLHAGWRGIVAGILQRGIDRLGDITGAPTEEFVMHCGVAIGEANYEVGVDVIEQLGLESATGPRRVDLRQILARHARAAGVRKITLSPWCTYEDSQLFWSHRRNPAAAGRMIAYLGRPLT